MISTSFRYWGKARPVDDGAAFHLLPYHCLDVAAVGRRYLQGNDPLLQWFCKELGTNDADAVCNWLTFWLALHDLGKFSISFQGQCIELVEQLQGAMPRHAGLPNVRHDSLGYHAWLSFIEPMALAQHWFGDDADVQDGLQHWARAVTGHHGQPPQNNVTHLGTHFQPHDVVALKDFVNQARALWLSPAAAGVASVMEPRDFDRASSDLSWWVAGLAVLADWIGSNATVFRYRAEPMLDIAGYWDEALGLADGALRQCGVLPAQRRALLPFGRLFPFIDRPSPLQTWASTVDLSTGPQLHLLEDVTGAGKTEAAVMLTHRLMAQGDADGFFIGLPTMATANAMYGRIATVHDQLFDNPVSLALAHANRTLVEDFAASVVEAGTDEADPQQLDDSATRRCLRWLADHNKRALLAPAGVGTIDQALLGVLQSKHQSLRLLGLVRKVLVVDEVHACDAYMQRTLETLLTFHARAGGSAVLLSATLTTAMKSSLVNAFANGCGASATLGASALDYPLVTSWHAALPAVVRETPVATRPEVRRSVRIRYESDRAAIVAGIAGALAAGACVAWIRNTVGDALAAHAELTAVVGTECVTLFHARFTLGDRLDIEDAVLAQFGPTSTPAQRTVERSGRRTGRLLIATQVAEQSLDVDFDLVVTDLAPIDRLIQRAGRLRRHVRDASGARLTSPGSIDQRGEPCLWVLGPAWTDAPASSWFRKAFPKSSKVYGHHGQLWRTARAMQGGRLTMPDDARALIEAVFGDDDDLPEGLHRNAGEAEGHDYADASQANANGVTFKNGYARKGTDWMADTAAPSRLGEDTVDVLLGRWDGDTLVPWRNDKTAKHQWAYSTVRVARRLISDTTPETSPKRRSEVERVKTGLPGGGKWVVLLALDHMGDTCVGTALTINAGLGTVETVWAYSPRSGLVGQSPSSTNPATSQSNDRGRSGASA